MTDRELMQENRDCGADAAAYVLGALEPEEAEAFRAHMAGCAVCRDEVSAFQQVADALPLAAQPQPVPKGLKRRVMAGVKAEPRGSGAAHGRRGWLPRLFESISTPALAAAAVVAVLVVAGVVALSAGGGSGTHVYAARVAWNGTAQLRVTNGRGELTVRGMPAPPPHKVYQVWLLKSGKAAPTPTNALFSVTSSGSGSVGVPGDLHSGDAVLVTPEPDGGSAVPTHAPVLQARLS